MDRNRQPLAGLGLGDFDQPTDDVSPLHGQHIAEPLAGVKREVQRRNEARIRLFAEAFECRIRPRLVALPAAQLLDAEHRIVRPPIAVHREIHQYRHQLKNPVGGARGFRHRVAQEFADAQGNLGVMYSTGRGVPENDAEAVRWFRMAAEQGFASAQFNLGVMYSTGRGVPKNDTEAVRWYRMAAEQGVADAQFNMGYMYATGEGIPKDYVQAYAWYNIAAAQGHKTAKENLEIITTKMSTAGITKAQELSREYWEAYGPNRASSE